MKIKCCTTNLDLHARGMDDETFIQQFSSVEGDEVEWEELHCLGHCFWCQQGPIAIVNEVFERESKN